MTKTQHAYAAICVVALLNLLPAKAGLAQNYEVSGAGTASANGVYVNDGTHNSRPHYTKTGSPNYYMFSDGSRWIIAQSDLTPYWNAYYFKYDSGSTPPTSGWQSNYGSSPSPSVNVAGPRLTYSASTFTESSGNSGGLDNTTPVTITHNNYDGQTFTGANNDNFVADGKVTVSNLPSGLTAVVTRTSSTVLTVTITGTASSHANANDVSNLTFAFQNSAFSNNDASAVTGATKSDLAINFVEQLNVGTGQTYTTIASAVSAASNGDIIWLAAQTFTENGISFNNKTLRFVGQGATSTIIQGAASYNTASDRIFNITFDSYSTSNTVVFENLTLRYGKKAMPYEVQGSYGGAIRGNNINLTITGCEVYQNVAAVEVPHGWYGEGGGAIAVNPGSLTVTNSTFADNVFTCNATRYGDWMGGGAILISLDAAGSFLTLTNVTFSGNSSSTHGGAIFMRNGADGQRPITATNVTFVNNAAGKGGAMAFNESGTKPYTFKNTLFYGNTRVDNGSQLWVSSSSTYTFENSLVQTFDESNISGTFTNTVTGSDPLLGSLADNGGSTRTVSISTGSPAINAGTATGAPEFDQRSYARVGATDIGAFEFGGAPQVFAGGDGSFGNPYQVSNATQLNEVRNYLSSYFIQTADIDLTNETGNSNGAFWNSGSGWSPIGNGSAQFTGSYDGNKKTISGLYINRSGTWYNGLFGYSNSGATIKNVILTSVNITGSGYTAALVGAAFGITVTESSASGTVSGAVYVGGLVGGLQSGGEVFRSFSTVSVTGSGNYTGGLVGYGDSNTSINDSYATGSVSTTSGDYIGGLIGYARSATTVYRSYSTGVVSVRTNSGGFVGDIFNSSFENSYWNNETSGQTVGENASGLTGKTTAELKTQGTFSGWNFSTTWAISPGVNNGYPFLQWEYDKREATVSSYTGFRLLAAPVTASYASVLANVWTQGATGGKTTNGSPNVWTWNNGAANDLASNWTGVTDLTANVSGTGAFLLYHYDDKDFNGRDNASAMLTLYGSEKAAPGAVSLNTNASGWTFVGNPFASTIGWNLVSSKTNIQADARVWNPTADNTGNWTTISGSGKIAPFQGFFVQTSGNGAASMTISADAKTTAGTFYGKEAAELHELVFQFKNGTMMSEPRARMHADASFGRDAYDGDRMAPLAASYLDAYFTSSEGRAHSNNAVPVVTEAYEMPLYVEMTQSGKVTITVASNTFPANVKVELLDLKTGSKMTVNGDFNYTFDHVKAAKVRSTEDVLKTPVTMAANETALRFKLILTPDAATSNENTGAVKVFALEQNYPNPFNPMTTINFSTATAGKVTLTIMNMLGQTVATVTDGVLPAGRHAVNFDASKLASGVYLYRLQAGNQVQTRKMTLLK